VARGESYLQSEEFLLINAKVKGGNSGGPLINKKGYAVGILVNAPLNSGDASQMDQLGYGIAVPGESFTPLLGPPSLLIDLPFINLPEGGFSTLLS
jgi:serine protease Do